ncbi:hypothetical protein [Ensifer adhaerens]|uniref:hypothetical protein n=1 Tax=Ensifer adhaerens TaxID=106592 RepID=UPI003CD02C87
MSIKHLFIAAVLLTASHSAAAAQSCEKNFKASGVPLVTPVYYKTWQEFPKLKPEAALQRMARGVAAEGFSGIEINKSLGTIEAYQDTAGSGRLQTLRVVARKRGSGTRIDAMFDIQVGQVATKQVVQEGLCNIIRSAVE